MIHCLHCRTETANGLALCDICQRLAASCLEYLPVYFRNLARWRPDRAGPRAVPGSQEPHIARSASSDRVTRALDLAGTQITTWARMLLDDRPSLAAILPAEPIAADLSQADEYEVIRLLSWGLSRHLVSIATLDWCGEFVTTISHLEQALRRLTDGVAPGWYAGSCHDCGHPTYVVPGLTWATCAGCGATTHAQDRLPMILDEARSWTARPMGLAEVLVALLDTEQSVPRLYERIKKWDQRGRLTAVRSLDRDGAPAGPKRYRLGDILGQLDKAE